MGLLGFNGFLDQLHTSSTVWRIKVSLIVVALLPLKGFRTMVAGLVARQSKCKSGSTFTC